MLIVRDVYYSAIDENGEERLFSVNEIMTEEEYLQREFGEKLEGLVKKGDKAAAAAQKEATKEAIAEGEKGAAKPGFLKRVGGNIKAAPGKYFEGVGNQGKKLAGKNNEVIKALGNQIAKHNKIAGTGLAVAGTGAVAGAGILANKKLKKGKKEKTFSKEEKGEDAKLKKMDKLNLWMYKHQPKYFKKIDKQTAEGDYKSVPKSAAAAGLGGAVSGAVGGGILGKMAGTGVLKTAGKQAALSGAGGAAGGAIGAAAGVALQRAIRGKSKKYDNLLKKKRDLYRVGDEEISKEDFVNKWYKKKDKKNK